MASRLFLASVVAALVPIVVATARGIRRGWLPVGDNALFAIRTHDVFTIDHQPLLGTWSSASTTAAVDVNHPGPLLFDLLALPARLFEGGAGIALGVALLNGAALIGIAVFAHRRGGPLLATVAMTAAVALEWSIGSEILYEPWGPHTVLLPFLFFLVLVWSVTCGDLVALPFAVGAGSLVLQTHLSYALLVPLLGAWAVAGLLVEMRRRRIADPAPSSNERRDLMRWSAAAGVVLVLCWLAPLIEQFTGQGRGNLSRLVESATDQGEAIGFNLGTRLTASVIALPPWWFRDSFRDAIDASASAAGWHPSSLAVAIAGIVVVAAMLAAGAWDARRRHDRDIVRLLAVAGVTVFVALLTSGRAPQSPLEIAPHQFRYLWPIGAFVWFALVATLVRRVSARPVVATRVVGAFAALTVVLMVANLPTSDQGVIAGAGSIAIARDLDEQLARHEIDGTVLVEGAAPFGDAYSSAVMASLQRRAVSFVVADDRLVQPRHLGPSRESTGDDADALLTVAYGDDVAAGPPGARRVAVHEALTPRERRELTRLERQLRSFLADGRLRLSERGRAALADGDLPLLEPENGQRVDPESLLRSLELSRLVRDDLLVLDDRWAARFDRYVSLRDEWERDTVALFLGPLDET